MTETGVMERFWAKVTYTEDGCWIWGKPSNGYGVFWNGSRQQVAHRFLFESVNGAVPFGFELDHLCRVKRCVNPNHLEVVTRSQNTARGIGPSIARANQLAKTHCPHGHPYDEVNTYIKPNGGSRDCKICRSNTMRNWWRENGNKYWG
ncbi:hypothetical protein LCGC14_0388060 [marine sediment metagenome]|uniref:HNH nuclease domain-containing protein n=1 Tax=marine sediment metagenome TaxID=412755 RepID=A0A0F9T6E7_9ZZZZ